MKTTSPCFGTPTEELPEKQQAALHALARDAAFDPGDYLRLRGRPASPAAQCSICRTLIAPAGICGYCRGRVRQLRAAGNGHANGS